MADADLKALALEFLGAFAAIQQSADTLAHYIFDERIVPTAAGYLRSRLRLNDEDRWQLVESTAKDIGANLPDAALFKDLKRSRDFVAHQRVSIGDRDGVTVLTSSRTAKNRLEQWNATEAQLRQWTAAALQLAQEIRELGDGHLYTTVTSTLSTSWNVLAPAEEDASPSRQRDPGDDNSKQRQGVAVGLDEADMSNITSE